MATPPRKYETQCVHAIRRRVGYTDNAAGGVEIGVIPAGSFVKGVSASVEIAFAGTSPTVSVGTAAVPAAIASSANLAPGAAGYKAGVLGSANGNITADTPVMAFVGGTGLTAGLVDLLVEYYPHPL